MSIWNIKYEYDDNFLELIKADRKFTDEQLDAFINIVNCKFRNPNLLPNVDKAVNRIKKAIANNEKITIVGDYDADGITATATMYMGIHHIYPHVETIIPKRSDGYGIKKVNVDECIKNNTKLIITVDNGIAGHEAIKYAEENDIDVIVTDHHQHLQKDLPCEIVVDMFIDENYPFKSVCGCMVAYKILRLLIPDLHKQEIHKDLVALTTIATVADVMPLIDENRKFVYNGLKIINAGVKNFGIRALIAKLGKTLGNITSTDIGYYISPALNATGRMADAQLALDLLLCDDEVTADMCADKVVKLNNKRKESETSIMSKTIVNEDDKFIIQVYDDKDVKAGILGIVAGKIASKYNKPCFVLVKKNGKISGSGRSVGTYDISKCVSENFDICQGGGHMSACGVSVEESNFDEFKRRCIDNFSKWLETATRDEISPSLDVLCELKFNQIDDILMDYMNKLSPYGEGNREIIFCTLGAMVKKYSILGKNKNTLKLEFEGGLGKTAICFNELRYTYEKMEFPQKIDIAYKLAYNYFGGNRSIQLMLVDIKPSLEKECD